MQVQRFSKPWRVVVALLAAAPVMAVAISLQRYFVSRLRGAKVDWADVLASHVSFWIAWTIVGGATAYVVLRTIRTWRNPFLGTLSLVVTGILSVVAQPVLDIAQRVTVLPPRIETPTAETFSFFIFAALPSNVLLYMAIVGLPFSMWYYEHFRDRELVAAQLGAQLTQARLDALRAQLNPHFLFNAMNSIAMLVRGNSNAQAVRMLAGLSDLLRWALDDGLPQEIPLSQELQFIERYLSIEQVRFQNRLRVEMAIDDRARGMLVPTLVLQPLVENAIRHGIGTRRAAGALRISAIVDDATLVLEVQDDGPGPSTNARDPEGTGVGLRNTEARLGAAFGRDWSLTLLRRVEGGASATVRLPARAAGSAGALGSPNREPFAAGPTD